VPAFVLDKNVELLTKHGVLSRSEMMARHEIHMENYCKIIRIEAATLIDMVQHMILERGHCLLGRLCSRRSSPRRPPCPATACRVETALAGSVSHLDEELLDRCAELKTALETMPAFATRARKRCATATTCSSPA
jgi:glutamine synthetase